MNAQLCQLRISFDETELVIPLPEDESSTSFGLNSDYLLSLPNGEQIEVYAEVNIDRSAPDISISVVEQGRVTAVRGSIGVVLSYTTNAGLELLLQVGSGAWEE